MVERPDDSGQFDDETLLDIIADRFENHANPITRRDAAWLVALAREAFKMRESADGQSRNALNCGEKST